MRALALAIRDALNKHRRVARSFNGGFKKRPHLVINRMNTNAAESLKLYPLLEKNVTSDFHSL